MRKWTRKEISFLKKNWSHSPRKLVQEPILKRVQKKNTINELEREIKILERIVLRQREDLERASRMFQDGEERYFALLENESKTPSFNTAPSTIVLNVTQEEAVDIKQRLQPKPETYLELEP